MNRNFLLSRRARDTDRHALEPTYASSYEFTPRQAKAMANLDMQAAREKNTTVLMRDMPVITGVLGNVKPSASIEGSDALARFAETMGLVYRRRDNGMAVISRSEAIADELVGAFKAIGERSSTVDYIENEYRIGELLGFPKTAAEYYVARSINRTSLPDGEELPIIRPTELEGTARGMLVALMLSPDHWREEIEEYVIPIESSLWELAPATYQAYEEEAKARSLRKVGSFAADHYGEDLAIQWV